MGLPKALVELDGEPLVRRALRTLVEGGAAPVVVVLGARADDVRAVLPADVAAVEATGWRDGMGASLRAGLAALEDTDATAAVVHLVDLPGVSAAVVSRLIAAAGRDVLRARRTGAGRGTRCCSGARTGRGCGTRRWATRARAATSPGDRTSCWWSAPTWPTRTTSTPRSSWRHSAAAPLRGSTQRQESHVHVVTRHEGGVADTGALRADRIRPGG